MNKYMLKKAVAALLTGAVLLGFTGCLDFGGSKKAVLAAAETLAADMAAADASELIKNSTLDKKSDEAKKLTKLLSNEDSTDDEKAFYKAVEYTIEYEIDAESVNVKKDEASVNIVFSIADYSKVLQEDFKNINDLTSAIKKADTTEIKFTAEFVKEGKEWIADNVGSKKFNKLYAYRNEEIDFSLTAEMIRGFIDYSMSSFWLTENNKYVDTDFIEFDYYFDSAVLDYADRDVNLYYILKKDDEPLYYSDNILFGVTTNVGCRIDAATIGLSDGACFEAGYYSIELYYRGEDGDELIDSNSITVEKTVIPTPTSAPGGNTGSTFDGEGDYFAFNDDTFRSYVLGAEWFDYDGCMLSDDVYTTDVITLAFSIKVTADCKMTLDYGYYFTDSDDTDSIGTALQDPVYSGTVTPSSYSNGYYYDIDYDVDGEAEPGYYMFVIYESGTQNVLMYGFCMVTD